MPDIADFETHLADANTTFKADFDAIFGQAETQPGSWALITETGIPVDGETLKLVLEDDLSEVREWHEGEDKRYEGARSYSVAYEMKTFYAAKELPRKRIAYDKSGATSRMLTRFLQRNQGMINKIVWDKLLTNPVGYDGVALLSTAHPNAPGGGTQSNKTTDALSHTSYRAARAAQKQFRMENGEYLEGLDANLLIVNPDDEDIAAEVIKASQRPVAVNNTGAEATSGVVAVTTIDNVFAGAVNIVLEPRLTAGDWLLACTRIAGVRPWCLTFGREIEEIVADAMNDSERRRRDVLQWALETDLVQGPGYWQSIYGKLS